MQKIYIETHTDDPVILSTYGHNLERRILDKISYEVDIRDIPQ
jgi:hypothetical protein